MPHVLADYRSRVYERYAGGCADEPAQNDRSRIEQRGPYLKQIVRRFFPSSRDAAILDVGCGHGALIHHARSCGYRNIAGVDRSIEQVDLARRLGIAGVVHGDLLDTLAVLSSESYDIVVAFDVIEHLTRDELVILMDQVYRVLRPGGKWILHTPNGASIFFGGVRYGDPTHETAFTESSITQVLRCSGFREVSCYEDAPVPHGFRSAARWLLWKLFRSCLSFWYAVETGGPLRICSQNFLTVTIKQV